MKPPLKLLLVDDHEVVRLGLRALFSRHGWLKVVGEAETAQESINKAAVQRPDVIIMDYYLREGDCTEAIRRIVNDRPQTRIIVLTGSSEDEPFFRAITAGATGYILKEVDSERLVEAVRAVAGGDSVLDPRMTRKILRRVKSAEEPREEEGYEILTWQEKRILSLIAEGQRNREIASRVRLSEKTVRNYVSKVLNKLNLQSRTQAAAFAIRHELAANGSPEKKPRRP